MATNHKSIIETDLHESKGVAGALADSVYVANGSGSGAWKRIFVSPNQSIVATPFTIEVAHSLNQVPKNFQGHLKNTTGELGYSVGDMVDILSAVTAGIYANSSKVGVIVSAAMQILRKDTSVLASITPANWVIVLTATPF